MQLMLTLSVAHAKISEVLINGVYYSHEEDSHVDCLITERTIVRLLIPFELVEA